MIEPTHLDWLALCLVTESNRPDEWPYVAQVIENRRYTGRWGNTYDSVVLAPKQFSAFNPFVTEVPLGHQMDIFRVLARQQLPLLLMHAAAYVQFAIEKLRLGVGPHAIIMFSPDINKETLHYYSPVSMKPAGSKPAWADSAKRLYTPEMVDPDRFVFAEGVA